jgi:Domain of unknown function (DUF4115)
VQPNIAGACAECNADQGGRCVAANTDPVVELSGRKLSDILFWVLAGVGAALFVAVVLMVAGVIPVDSASEPDPEPADAVGQPHVTTAPPENAATTERATTSAVTTPRAAEPAVVVLTAVRGDSWFSARVGSESGRVLDERVLAQGESVRLQAKQIWLSVGAAGNVEVTVNGKPRELSPGTVSVLLTPADATAAN